MSICQNYNAAFESKNCHNRLLLLEFRIEWRFNRENSDLDSDINLLARREFYINKTVDQKQWLYPIISNMFDENNMIIGLKVDIIEKSAGSQSLYVIELPNPAQMGEPYKVYDNKITTSYYKRYRKNFSQVIKQKEFLQDHETYSVLFVEARLNNVNDLKAQGYKDTELNLLLRDSVCTILNMKPMNIHGFMYRNVSDLFQSIECLSGLSHADFLLNDPQQFQEKLDLPKSDYEARNLLRQIT